MQIAQYEDVGIALKAVKCFAEFREDFYSRFQSLERLSHLIVRGVGPD
jgi:hypothetical protein